MRVLGERLEQWLFPGLTRSRRQRALVIEDDESQVPVLKRALQLSAPGIQVDWVDTADAGLGAIAREAYDLVVADIFLRGPLSGIEFWNRSQELLGQTRVLFMSAMPEEIFAQALGPSAICPAFIQKPFKFAECARVIEGLLRDV